VRVCTWCSRKHYKKNTKRAQLTEYNIMHYKHAITIPQENELRGQTTRFKALFFSPRAARLINLIKNTQNLPQMLRRGSLLLVN
jgi:hypothetical protein